MTLSHFPFGVSSFGAPVTPNVPFGGSSKYYYVDSVNGNDNNSGTDPSQAFATVAKGYSVLRDGYYDTLFLIGLGTAFPLTVSLAWTKSYTNVVGLTAPLMVSERARITNGSALMTPLINVSGVGNSFYNVQMANFGSHATAALVGVEVSGIRNYFNRCHLAGMGGATTATETAGRSLLLSGASESLFEDTTIGLDTVARTAANYELEMALPANARVHFKNCTILRYSTGSGAGGGFIKIGTDCIDRWCRFDNPIFINATVGGGAALTTGVVAGSAQAIGGFLVLNNPLTAGMTGWTGGTDTSLIVQPAYGAATTGLGANPTT